MGNNVQFRDILFRIDIVLHSGHFLRGNVISQVTQIHLEVVPRSNMWVAFEKIVEGNVHSPTLLMRLNLAWQRLCGTGMFDALKEFKTCNLHDRLMSFCALRSAMTESYNSPKNLHSDYCGDLHLVGWREP